MLIICLIMYIIDFYLQNVKMIPFDELCFLGRVVGGVWFHKFESQNKLCSIQL